MNEEEVHVGFAIHYNWPPGKDSFSGLHIDKESVKKGFRTVVMAKENEDSQAYTFDEFSHGPLSMSEISHVITEGSSRGRYLTGNIFVIEIYNKDNKCIGKTKIDAKFRRPSEASGPTSVHQNYFLTKYL
jgi:hypothetical protein